MKRIFFISIVCIFVFNLMGCSSAVAKKEKKETLIIAHRGADDRAPEETMPAFRLAVNEKADYIELDLRETKDNKLILMHDPTLDRTTNGKGDVTRYSLKQIKKLDAGSWFGKKYKGQRILTLEELINQYGSKTNYFIETRRVGNELKMEEPLIRLLNKKGLIKKKKVMIESFSARSLEKIHKLDRSVPLVQLTLFKNKKDFTDQKIREWRKYAVGIGLDAKLADKKLIQKMHQNHLKVYVFFFDSKKEKAEQKRVIEDGADGVFTNHLTYTKALLK
ncbi:glycerophosphodiester phosphodiesterase family protein [Heyndrickxia coagulans]|uniref:Glycerophosphoryl diester phosphodiesterase n=2 Tax=Heyndrickxia coagulans TaxID=1398 RepID=A0A8B4BX32_HEYCO|nr:glycerophosphodiester phosphodiesterase family protein [Heyndrickxia coagulans]AJH78969.1 glycerophosphoryl diester phosphodiesterase family protein [Heyndrickxia coagulans DSM 1 = ATCC 7050]MCR2847404.1 glycerophosphodiester phosphodiesterase [Heyndrickxia coagulans]MDR4225101.1 glycerophosphodiester phosphodiesterase [Heyndrickxia coagulans DSM 1 = ATCC 7050]MED4492708.1 glycerophosphodiester phosphodiesterase family protein [Heyndrickxia coagulans]MED4537283.1 glycerophosphodiester phosp